MPAHDGPELPAPDMRLTPLIPAADRPHPLANPFVSELWVPRHPAVAEVLRYFEFEHLPEHLREISQPFHELAHDMAGRLEGPQLANGLQRLLEAKDCMVRAAITPPKATGGPIRSGQAYIVGERGCDLAMPPQPGH